MLEHPLCLILALPCAGLLLLFFVPAGRVSTIRAIATAAVLLPALLSVWVFCQYNQAAGGFQFEEKYPWVSSFGIFYHLGVDGINAMLILLLGLCSFAGVLVNQSVKDRVKEYYILFLLMVVGTYGAFLSLDIFSFYFFHEIATVPAFLMIAIWGTGRKDYAAMKLTLYLTAGATLALLGLIALYFAMGIHTFDLVQAQQFLAVHPLPPQVQFWLFPLVFVGFGVTLTLWPFYTWAPVGYAEAPTSVSMLHAGVLKKLGAYAILRFAIGLMPDGAHMWMPVVADLAVLNILYCGLVALTQRDLKYILGYSSCSHMGYILLGMACMNVIGINGVVFLMFAHGIMAALAFALTGYISDQTRTRNLDQLGGLTKSLPFVATFLAITAMASAGVPGFANFVAEILVLIGSWDQYRWQTVCAILGIVVTAIYMFKTIRFALHGPMPSPWGRLVDAQTLMQKLPFVVLLAALVLVGCFPSVLLSKIGPAATLIGGHITH